jgi:hypothetical protein
MAANDPARNTTPPRTMAMGTPGRDGTTMSTGCRPPFPLDGSEEDDEDEDDALDGTFFVTALSVMLPITCKNSLSLQPHCALKRL